MSEARPIRDRVETIIFGTETRAGNLFDLTLLILILASVFVVMLDSVEAYHAAYGDVFRWVELGFTLIFAVEYLTRLWCLRRPAVYAISFWGVVDLLAILPTFLTLFVPEASSLIVIRVLRVSGLPHPASLRVARGIHRDHRTHAGYGTIDHGVLLYCDGDGGCLRLPALRNRRTGARLCQHSDEYLLGRRDNNNRRLWGCRPGNADGPVCRLDWYFDRLFDFGCADGHRNQ